MVEPQPRRLTWNTGRRMPLRTGIAFACLALGFMLLLPIGKSFCDDRGDKLFRVGFSTSMFTDVNENDARAAMRAWAQAMFKERGLPVDSEMVLMNNTRDVSRALRNNLVDAVALTTDEYWALAGEMHSSEVVVGVFDGSITDQYLLLVHRQSGIERVSDLRGRSIIFFQSPRMSLASVWMDTLLAKEGLGTLSKYCSRVAEASRLPRVILPVFFRQNDACVVTRRGFETMSELNPQVGKQLKIIASSPEVVPSGLFIRPEFSHPLRDKVIAELDKIHLTSAGQQALTLFKSERLEIHSISVLTSSFELLDGRNRSSSATKDAGATAARTVSGGGGEKENPAAKLRRD